MRAKLIIEGKEFDIDIFDPELQKIVTPKKQTGYENVGTGHVYYYVNDYGEIKNLDHDDFDDDTKYDIGNYYSNYEVAKNNARADRLMRQLRRFAVEHRENDIDWQNEHRTVCSIEYDDRVGVLNFETRTCHWCRTLGVIYFDSEETTKLAMDIFHDELIWYFTEYKDNL